MKSYNCLNCNNEFWTYESNHRKFCSKKCAYDFRKGKPSWNKDKKGYKNSGSFKQNDTRRGPLFQAKDNHWNWQGGITSINQSIRQSTDMKKWKKAVLERDNYTCVWCSSKEDLQVDHIKPFSLFPELRFVIDNGRTLCENCHSHTATYAGKMYKLYKNNEFIAGKTRVKYGGPYLQADDYDTIMQALVKNGGQQWTIGENGQKLEEELSAFTGVKHTALTNSGSSALLVAYATLGLPEGSEVITGAVHFPTTISSLYYNHLTPVFIDVEEATLGMNPDLIEQAITDKTKAIVVVAIAGSIPQIDRILEIAKRHNLITILDNCDGFGGRYKGELLETYFDISATSFHAAHILCMGEGGAVFTNRDDWGEKSLSLREWGRLGGYDGIDDKKMLEGIPEDYPARYLFKYMGFNVKPLELQCALGRTQLLKLPEIKERRRQNYSLLEAGLQDIPQVQLLDYEGDPSWFGFPIFAQNRGGLRDFLENRQIETRTIFGGNITKQPAFRDFGRIATALPISDRVMTEGMFISVHPDVTPEMIEYMIESILEFYK